MNRYFILRIKKPHKKFNIGDIVIGYVVDGQAERMTCIGWSSKFNRPIFNYSIRYQYWIEKQRGGYLSEERVKRHAYIPYPSGHGNKITSFQSDKDIFYNEDEQDKLRVCKTKSEFFQLIFGGKLLGLEEAAATLQKEINKLSTIPKER